MEASAPSSHAIRYDAAMSAELKLHHCTVDLTRAQALWPEREVSLTDAEVKLLAFMAERRSEDIPRGDLLQHVWGYSPTVRSRAVDQTVKRLRRKIEADPSTPSSLLSVYGVGYRLVLPVTESVERLTMTPGRLPRLVGTTWGRSSELTELAAPSDDGRAIVLTGPPGVGKSRVALAHAAAFRTQEDPAGGVWVVDCDPARSSAELLSAIQYTLSIAGEEATSPAALAELIHRRGPALIVLDNCDAIDGLDRTLVELARSSAVRWLVTTRRRLGPDVQHIDMGPLAEDAAIELFRERASWVMGTGRLPDRDTQRLVEALECNPLALCLAAARTNLLSPAELLKRFGSDPKLLSAPQDDAHQRYSSLERALAGSWELLSEEEQTSLVSLTVFMGSFALEAAEAVVGDAAIGRLQSLCDRSLLEPRDEGRGRVYRLPLLVRSFAGSRSPRALVAARSRLEHHLALLHTRSWTAPSAFAWDAVLPLLQHRADLELAFRSCSVPERAIRLGLALAEVERIRGNAYAQTRILRSLRKRFGTPEDPDLALYLGTLTARNRLIHRTQDERRDALHALEPLVDRCQTMAAPLHWLRDLGRQAMPDASRLQATSSRIRSWAERCTDPLWEAVALLFIGRFEGVSGQLDTAVECFEHALALCADRGMPVLHAYTLYSRGYAAMEQGSLDTAHECFRDACELLEEVGDPRSTMVAAMLGMVAMLDNRFDEAEKHYRASARYADAHASDWTREDEYLMGSLSILRGDMARAEKWLASSVAFGRRWGAGAGASAPMLAATRVATGTDPARVSDLLKQGPSWSPLVRAAVRFVAEAAGEAECDEGSAELDSPSHVSTTMARQFLAQWRRAKRRLSSVKPRPTSAEQAGGPAVG